MAARWFSDTGHPVLALEHASASRDGVLIADLLLDTVPGLVLSGASSSVRSVLAALPPNAASTPAALCRALVALEDGDLTSADQALAAAAPTGDPRVKDLDRAVRLHLARLRGDLPGARDAGLLAPDPPVRSIAENPDVRSLRLVHRAALFVVAGDHRGAGQDLGTALELATAANRDLLALSCLAQLSGATAAASDLNASRAWSMRAADFADQRGWSPSPRMAYAYGLAAWTSHESLDLQAAQHWSTLATGVVAPGADPEAEGVVLATAAVIAFDHPDLRLQALRDFRVLFGSMADPPTSPALLAHCGAAVTRMCIVFGRWNWAKETVDALSGIAGTHTDGVVQRAALLLAGKRPAEAARALWPVLSGDLPPATGDTLTLAWLVAAAAELRRGEETSARRAVQSALTAAQPSRSMRPFYDAGPPVRALLEELEADAGPQEEFLATVLERCRAADRWLGDTAGSSPGNELPGDPPTARELEVLAELRSPRTLAEIAERRSVSLNTIKTQTGSLYRKLGVQGRRQAVAAGRRLGLL